MIDELNEGEIVHIALPAYTECLLGLPADTPYGRYLMPSSTGFVAVVIGACCHINFLLGKLFTTTAELGASTVPRSSYIMPCAIVYAYASSEILTRVRAKKALG